MIRSPPGPEAQKQGQEGMRKETETTAGPTRKSIRLGQKAREKEEEQVTTGPENSSNVKEGKKKARDWRKARSSVSTGKKGGPRGRSRSKAILLEDLIRQNEKEKMAHGEKVEEESTRYHLRGSLNGRRRSNSAPSLCFRGLEQLGTRVNNGAKCVQEERGYDYYCCDIPADEGVLACYDGCDVGKEKDYYSVALMKKISKMAKTGDEKSLVQNLSHQRMLRPVDVYRAFETAESALVAHKFLWKTIKSQQELCEITNARLKQKEIECKTLSMKLQEKVDASSFDWESVAVKDIVKNASTALSNAECRKHFYDLHYEQKLEETRTEFERQLALIETDRDNIIKENKRLTVDHEKDKNSMNKKIGTLSKTIKELKSQNLKERQKMLNFVRLLKSKSSLKENELQELLTEASVDYKDTNLPFVEKSEPVDSPQSVGCKWLSGLPKNEPPSPLEDCEDPDENMMSLEQELGLGFGIELNFLKEIEDELHSTGATEDEINDYDSNVQESCIQIESQTESVLHGCNSRKTDIAGAVEVESKMEHVELRASPSPRPAITPDSSSEKETHAATCTALSTTKSSITTSEPVTTATCSSFEPRKTSTVSAELQDTPTPGNSKAFAELANDLYCSDSSGSEMSDDEEIGRSQDLPNTNMQDKVVGSMSGKEKLQKSVREMHKESSNATNRDIPKTSGSSQLSLRPTGPVKHVQSSENGRSSLKARLSQEVHKITAVADSGSLCEKKKIEIYQNQRKGAGKPPSQSKKVPLSVTDPVPNTDPEQEAFEAKLRRSPRKKKHVFSLSDSEDSDKEAGPCTKNSSRTSPAVPVSSAGTNVTNTRGKEDVEQNQAISNSVGTSLNIDLVRAELSLSDSDSETERADPATTVPTSNSNKLNPFSLPEDNLTRKTRPSQKQKPLSKLRAALIKTRNSARLRCDDDNPQPNRSSVDVRKASEATRTAAAKPTKAPAKSPAKPKRFESSPKKAGSPKKRSTSRKMDPTELSTVSIPCPFSITESVIQQCSDSISSSLNGSKQSYKRPNVLTKKLKANPEVEQSAEVQVDDLSPSQEPTKVFNKFVSPSTTVLPNSSDGFGTTGPKNRGSKVEIPIPTPTVTAPHHPANNPQQSTSQFPHMPGFPPAPVPCDPTQMMNMFQSFFSGMMMSMSSFMQQQQCSGSGPSQQQFPFPFPLNPMQMPPMPGFSNSMPANVGNPAPAPSTPTLPSQVFPSPVQRFTNPGTGEKTQPEAVEATATNPNSVPSEVGKHRTETSDPYNQRKRKLSSKLGNLPATTAAGGKRKRNSSELSNSFVTSPAEMVMSVVQESETEYTSESDGELSAENESEDELEFDAANENEDEILNDFDSPSSPCPEERGCFTTNNSNMTEQHRKWEHATEISHPVVNEAKKYIKVLLEESEMNLKEEWNGLVETGKHAVLLKEMDAVNLSIAFFSIVKGGTRVTRGIDTTSNSLLFPGGVSKLNSQLLLMIGHLMKESHLHGLAQMLLDYFLIHIVPNRTFKFTTVKDLQKVGQFYGLLIDWFKIPNGCSDLFFQTLYWRPPDAQFIACSALRVNSTYFNKFSMKNKAVFTLSDRLSAFCLTHFPQKLQGHGYSQLRVLLKLGLRWDVPDWTLKDLFANVVTEILEIEDNSKLQVATDVISLICRFFGSDCFPYLREQLATVTKAWMDKKVNDGVYAAVIRAIGFIGQLSLEPLNPEQLLPLEQYLEAVSPHHEDSVILQESISFALQNIRSISTPVSLPVTEPDNKKKKYKGPPCPRSIVEELYPVMRTKQNFQTYKKEKGFKKRQEWKPAKKDAQKPDAVATAKGNQKTGKKKRKSKAKLGNPELRGRLQKGKGS